MTYFKRWLERCMTGLVALAMTGTLVLGVPGAAQASGEPQSASDCESGETYFPRIHLANGEYLPSFCAPAANVRLECGVREAAWGLALGIASLVAGIVAAVPTAGASSVVAWAGAVGTATAAGGVYIAIDCWFRMS